MTQKNSTFITFTIIFHFHINHMTKLKWQLWPLECTNTSFHHYEGIFTALLFKALVINRPLMKPATVPFLCFITDKHTSVLRM